jgi:hypothetical protein
MPVHDWTLVEAGIFHAFHVTWVPEIQGALNGGILPKGFYALAEQHAGRAIGDLLTLYQGVATSESSSPPSTTGGTAVAEAPPKVRYRHQIESSLRSRRRSIAVRHVSGHRLVALIEVVSPRNKDRVATVEEFSQKAVGALDSGINFMSVDLFPPGRSDPNGMHGAILELLDAPDLFDEVSPEEPLTLASFVPGPPVEVFLERLRAGADLPAMPLFLSPGRYVDVPFESTYQLAYSKMPEFYRNVLEGRAQS